MMALKYKITFKKFKMEAIRFYVGSFWGIPFQNLSKHRRVCRHHQPRLSPEPLASVILYWIVLSKYRSGASATGFAGVLSDIHNEGKTASVVRDSRKMPQFSRSHSVARIGDGERKQSWFSKELVFKLLLTSLMSCSGIPCILA